MIATVLGLLRAAPLLWKVGIGLALFATLGGTYAIWHHKVYRSGYDAALHAVAAQNQEAINAVNDVRVRVRDCNATVGMRWDQASGQCVRGD